MIWKKGDERILTMNNIVAWFFAMTSDNDMESHFSLCLSLVVFACEPLQIGWPWRLINVSMSHAFHWSNLPVVWGPKYNKSIARNIMVFAKHYWSHNCCCFPCLMTCLLSLWDSPPVEGWDGEGCSICLTTITALLIYIIPPTSTLNATYLVYR